MQSIINLLGNADLFGFVVPAQAGIQLIKTLDPRLRGDDELICVSLGSNQNCPSEKTIFAPCI